MIKVKSTMLIIIVILSALIIGWNFGLGAKHPESELNGTSTSRASSDSRGNFDWGLIEAISEPILGLDYNGDGSEFPKVAVEDGKIYAVWCDRSNIEAAGSDRDIFFRYFDGGKWSDIEVVSEPVFGYNKNTLHSENPDIAVENGNVYVVWEDENDTNGASFDLDIFYRCYINGSGWHDIQVISEPTLGSNLNKDGSQNPTIAVEDGKIYVAWEDWQDYKGSGADWDVFYRCSLTGSSWEKIQVISEPIPGQNFNYLFSYDPEITVENGKIYVVWYDENGTNGSGGDADVFYRCNITGTSWEKVQVISEPVFGQDFNTGFSYDPDIAVENNKIYVVWWDNNNTNGAGPDGDIFLRCNLTGTSWENVQVISEPVQGENRSIGFAWRPAIAVENDKIHVVWTDTNETNEAGSDFDICYRCSPIGTTWDNIQVISEPVQDDDINPGYSINPDIAVENDNIYVVWEDNFTVGGSGSDRDILHRTTKNFAPVLSLPSVTPTSGDTGTYFNFTITYTHANNIAPVKITVNISGINNSMSETDPGDLNYQNSKSYYYNTALNISDEHTFQFWTSDGVYTRFTEIFDAPDVYNTPPTIIIEDNLTAIEDTYYEVSYEYEDIDIANIGQSGIWEFFTDADDWLAFNPATAVLCGTPSNDDVGEYWVNIVINDTIDFDHTNFTLTVIDVNDDPIITTSNIEIINEDEFYEVDYNATDIDSLIENQIWSLETNGSSWLNIESNEGIFSGTPTNDEVGSYWVNVSIDDGEDGSDFTNFTLAVLNVNDQPLIITEDKLTASVGELYEVDYNATDIDSPISEQIWSLNTNATWLRLSSDTGVLSGLPTLSDEGWYTVNVSVDDGDGGQDWHEFILTVEKIIDLNLPPLITTIDVVSITAEELYYVDYDAVDDRTPFNLLMWSFNTDASWLSFDKTTGALTGTPSLSDVGSYWVNVTVGDGEGGFNYHNFTLTVYSTANQPPEITTEDKSVTEVNKTYSIDYEATDDRTPINYLQWDLNTNASWLTIDTNTGVLSGTPELADVGIYWVNVSVTDGEDGWDYHDFKLRVLTESQIEENTAPELSNPEMTPSEGDTGTEFTFTVHYYDADGNEPAAIQLKIDGYTYNMDLKPTENPSNGVYECSIRLSEGPHTYYFNASDGLEIVNTDNITTPYIEKVSEVKDKVTEEKISWEIIIFIVILVIIMLLIIIDIIIRVKKKTEEETVQEPVEELLPPVPEEPVVEIPPPEPEVPKAPSATTPPVPLTEQPPQYATQPTQPSVPPSVTSKTFESPSTVSPTVAPPAVTQPPPTVPKVEPPERTLPEDATSEK